QHVPNRQLGDEEKSFDVDGDESPQIVSRILREGFREEDAGIVDKHIERSEPARGDAGDLFCRCRIADVPGNQREIVCLLERSRPCDVARVRNHIVSLSQEGLNNTCSDALRAAGHNYCFLSACHLKSPFDVASSSSDPALNWVYLWERLG